MSKVTVSFAGAQIQRVQGTHYAKMAAKAVRAKRLAKFAALRRYHLPAFRREIQMSAKMDAVRVRRWS